MFVFNFKAKKSKKLLAVIAAAVTVFLIVFLAAAMHKHVSPKDKAVSAEAVEYSLTVKNGNFTDFFNQLNIKADAGNSQIKTVTIPAEFNAAYQQYNDLQKHAGLDLTRYCGEEVQQITFPIQSDKADYAVLLIKKGRVIGGHLTNGEYGSEMLPLI